MAGDYTTGWIEPFRAIYPYLGFEVNVQRPQYPYGYVRRYGSVGDGITDDSTAVANAIACVNNLGGGDVITVDGDVHLVTSLSLQPGITFSGKGKIKWGNGFVYNADGSGGNVSPPKLEIIAHRGFSNAAPENTLAALTAAIGFADSLEGDIQFTSDHQPVVIHDDTVDRTCAPSSGLVTSFTLAAIQALDAGYSAAFGTEWANTRVPKFSDWLRLGAKSFKYLYPEIKGYNSTADIAVFVNTIKAQQLESRCIVQSFNFLIDFPILRQYSTKLRCGCLASNLTQLDQAITYAKADGNCDILCDYSVVLANTDRIATARSFGIDIIVWTVDQYDIARQLAEVGITRMISSLVVQLMVTP